MVASPMVDVTNALIYEVLKSVQVQLVRLGNELGEVKAELRGIRGHIGGMQHDITNIYLKLADHDDRLERIETRLGLIEPAH